MTKRADAVSTSILGPFSHPVSPGPTFDREEERHLKGLGKVLERSDDVESILIPIGCQNPKGLKGYE